MDVQMKVRRGIEAWSIRYNDIFVALRTSSTLLTRAWNTDKTHAFGCPPPPARSRRRHGEVQCIITDIGGPPSSLLGRKERIAIVSSHDEAYSDRH